MSAAERPDFSLEVAPNGYAWWYMDALSDDGLHGLTLIAFVGSVFSPYYARARRRAGRTGALVDAENHVAVCAALYGRGGYRWAMTERGRADLTRDRDSLQIADSRWHWDQDALRVELNEWTAPWLQPVRGIVQLRPDWLNPTAFDLASNGSHCWQPFAPRARVTVELSEPALRWQGHGYLDANHGAAPLADAFRSWNWSRSTNHACTEIVYAIEPRHRQSWGLVLTATAGGELNPTPMRDLGPIGLTRWRVPRSAIPGTTVRQTLEDTPFYSRSQICSRLPEGPAEGVHESLDLDRFNRPWVQCLLPFRMPRRAGTRNRS